MHTFKALISKQGGILSLTEETTEIADNFKVNTAPGSKYPDTVFVKAEDKSAAEAAISKILKEWLADDV